jgi:hypothetical protein
MLLYDGGAVAEHLGDIFVCPPLLQQLRGKREPETVRVRAHYFGLGKYRR